MAPGRPSPSSPTVPVAATDDLVHNVQVAAKQQEDQVEVLRTIANILERGEQLQQHHHRELVQQQQAFYTKLLLQQREQTEVRLRTNLLVSQVKTRPYVYIHAAQLLNEPCERWPKLTAELSNDNINDSAKNKAATNAVPLTVTIPCGHSCLSFRIPLSCNDSYIFCVAHFYFVCVFLSTGFVAL